jgi:hypothetical protein
VQTYIVRVQMGLGPSVTGDQRVHGTVEDPSSGARSTVRSWSELRAFLDSAGRGSSLALVVAEIDDSDLSAS